MKRLSLILILSLFLISFASAYTTNVSQYGATFLYTNESGYQFKTDLLANYPQCYSNNANATYRNYTASFDMLCHIWLNKTNGGWQNWSDLGLHFDMNSPTINKSHPLIVYENNTKIEFKRLQISATGGTMVAGNTYNLIGMPLHYYIGSCNPEAVNGPGLNTNYDSNTTMKIESSTFNYYSYNPTGSYNSTMSLQMFSFLCDAQLNNTEWVNVQPWGLSYTYGGGFGGSTGSNSYFASDTMISVQDKNPLSGTFTLKDVGSRYLFFRSLGQASGYCFVATGGTLKATFRNSDLICGGPTAYLSYGFASNSLFNFTDSTADSYLSSGFLATWNVLIKFTMKSEFRNSLGQLVNASYNFTDSQGKSYTNTATSMNEEIIITTYKGSGDINHNPFKVSIQNSSYFDIKDYNLTLATNNKGFLPLIQIPYAIELNPNSSFLLSM